MELPDWFHQTEKQLKLNKGQMATSPRPRPGRDRSRIGLVTNTRWKTHAYVCKFTYTRREVKNRNPEIYKSAACPVEGNFKTPSRFAISPRILSRLSALPMLIMIELLMKRAKTKPIQAVPSRALGDDFLANFPPGRDEILWSVRKCYCHRAVAPK